MNPRYFKILELDKILARLAAQCAFSASDHLARDLQPSTHPDEIAQRQAETSEARALLDAQPEISIGGARDIRALAQNARVGARLTPPEFLEIRQTIFAARTLRRSLVKLETHYPRLSARAFALAEFKELGDAITRAINERGEVADNASSELARIRRDLNATRSRLMDKLQRMLTSSTYAKLIQEPIITQREGRYVIPIRAEAKGKLQGIVHDTSASGATMFIEPLAVVEQGNHVRELERAEQREIERILRELTALVAVHADALDTNVETLAEIDLAFAKAKYSTEMRAVEPQFIVLSPESKVQRPNIGHWTLDLGLVDARHPLLDPDQVVPISISLGKDFSILIITGPNTGGKTVTLKTVGLFALMAQCGLHVPAKTARLPIFDGIFA
ncbi:MAG: endonuclease MutS2, partial [Chloroflexi bacterium]|nr:endonuclease MutS2 [Chloroflexota bacterium]